MLAQNLRNYKLFRTPDQTTTGIIQFLGKNMLGVPTLKNIIVNCLYYFDAVGLLVNAGRTMNNIAELIAQQIYYRYKKGLTADPRFANLNKAAELCCNLALKSIQIKSID